MDKTTKRPRVVDVLLVDGNKLKKRAMTDKGQQLAFKFSEGRVRLTFCQLEISFDTDNLEIIYFVRNRRTKQLNVHARCLTPLNCTRGV